MDYQKRVERLREFLEKKAIPAVLIKNPSNIFYLTGLLEIEGVLIIDKKDITFITPALYHQEAVDLATFKIDTIIYKKDVFKKFLTKYRKTGFIETELTFASYKSISSKHTIVPLPDFVKEMRKIKDKEEIDIIRKALAINKNVFRDIEKEIKEGIKETVIAGRIHYLIRQYGGRKEAFEPIVASGICSAYPHHKNRNKKIEKGKPVVVDAGVDYNGYKSDLTRTFFPDGSPDKRFRDIYKVLEEVQKKIVEFIGPDRTGGEVHSYAVGLLKKTGLDKYFIHGLGHGIGIDVHELPVLGPGSKDVIKKGCVLTVEPGVYIPGEGGIRLEEMIFLP